MMGNCVDKLLGKTPSGEFYVMKSFTDGKVAIELLQYNVSFEPKVIVHEGQISFTGTYFYDGKEHAMTIPGTNEIVKFYEKAMPE